MSEKSVWQGLGNLVGGWGKSAPAKPLPTSARRCEAGHPMAVDWVKCPYCEAERNAGQKTRMSDDAVPPSQAARTGGPGTTRLNDPPSSGRPDDGDVPRAAGRPARETTIDPMAGNRSSESRNRWSSLGGAWPVSA